MFQFTGDPSLERATGRDTLVVGARSAGPRRGRDRAQLHGERRRAAGYDLEQLAAARGMPRAAGRLGRRRRARAFRRSVFAGGRGRRAGRERLSLRRDRDSFTETLPARPRHRDTTMKLRSKRSTGSGTAGCCPRSCRMRQRQGADARLHERGSAGADADGAPGHVLQSQQATLVDQGRDLRKFPEPRRPGGGLRFGRTPGAGRACGTDLPQGHRVLFCRGRPDISRESRLPVDARGNHCAADRGPPGRQLHRAPVRRRTGTDCAEARGRRGARARGGEPRRRRGARGKRGSPSTTCSCTKARGLSLARAVAELTSRHEDKTHSQSTA